MALAIEHLTWTLWVPMLLFYIQQVFILYPMCSVQSRQQCSGPVPILLLLGLYFTVRTENRYGGGWGRTLKITIMQQATRERSLFRMQGPGMRKVVERKCVSSVRPVLASTADSLWLLLPSLGCIPPHTKQNSRGELMEQALTESGIIAREINSALWWSCHKSFQVHIFVERMPRQNWPVFCFKAINVSNG